MRHTYRLPSTCYYKWFWATGDGLTRSHRRSHPAFLAQWGPLPVCSQVDGRRGPGWGQYKDYGRHQVPRAFQLLPEYFHFEDMVKHALGYKPLNYWRSVELRQACKLRPFITFVRKRKKSNSSFRQMWQNTMSYKPSSLCFPTNENLKRRDKGKN